MRRVAPVHVVVCTSLHARAKEMRLNHRRAAAPSSLRNAISMSIFVIYCARASQLAVECEIRGSSRVSLRVTRFVILYRKWGYIECTESFLDMPEVCWVHREWRLHEYVATLCHIKKINGVALIKDKIFLAIFFIFVISFMRVSTLLVFCNMIKIIHSKSLCSTRRTWSLLAN